MSAARVTEAIYVFEDAGTGVRCIASQTAQRLGVVTKLARGIVKQTRIRGNAKARNPFETLIFKGRLRRQSGGGGGKTHNWLDLQGVTAGTVQFDLELGIGLPDTARRLEFELNSMPRHLARLQIRYFMRRKGTIRARFSGELRLGENDKRI